MLAMHLGNGLAQEIVYVTLILSSSLAKLNIDEKNGNEQTFIKISRTVILVNCLLTQTIKYLSQKRSR